MFLLDTVVIIMAAKTPERLSPRVAQLLHSPNETRLVSAVSLNEIAIKCSVGKLEFPATAVRQTLDDLAIQQFLSFTETHAFRMFGLPLFHRDPFDRQLIAQALTESIPVVTNDAQFRLYKNIEVIW